MAEVAAAPAVPLGGPPDDALRPGVEVGGHYRIEAVIGAGGMGVVYRALDLSLDRSVALKLHRWANDKSRDRLLREAKVMAKLSHPNVLAVHEVGTWREHVYLAAELVEGQTARQWQRVTRPWQESVRVYLAAGQGLSAAHRSGLVHRDFKPDNVLVGTDGRVRVADFGLARAAGTADSDGAEITASGSSPGASLSALTNLTQTGATVGTPAYMAPEQFMAEDLDGRADQFAFCVTLYEALYGKRPFSGRTSAALAAAIGRGPVRPPAQPRVPRRIRRALQRGLRPNPRDRFATMDDLLAELAAAARPRRVVAWGAAALGIGLAGVSWSRAEVDECAGVAQSIDAAWTDERREALAARYAADPDGAPSEWRALRTRVDRYIEDWGAARTELCRERGRMTPDLRDRALACLSDGKRELSALLSGLERGKPSRRQRGLAALALMLHPSECREEGFLLAAFPPPANVGLRGRVENARARVSTLRRTAWAGVDPLTVREELEQVRGTVEELGYGPLTAEFSYAHSVALRFEDRPEETKAALEEAYFAARETGHHRTATSAAKDLARLVGYAMGRTEAGLLWGRHAVTEALQGGVPLAQLVSAEHNLGIMHDTAGNWAEAEELYQRALDRLSTSDANYRLRRAEILVSVAALEGGRGQVDSAIAAAEEAIALYEEIYDGPHYAMIPAIGNIGFALNEAGRYDEAYGWHARALQIGEAVYGPGDTSLSVALINLAAAAQGKGDFASARRHYAEAERISVAHFGTEHPDVASVATNLASMAEAEGDHAAAAELRAKALRVFEATLGPVAPSTLRARVHLAQSQLRVGLDAVACRSFAEAAETTRHKHGDTRVLAEAMAGQGDCAMEQSEHELAVAHYAEAVRAGDVAAWAPSGRATIEFKLARALAEVSRTVEAIEAAGRARALYERADEEAAAAEVEAWIAATRPAK